MECNLVLIDYQAFFLLKRIIIYASMNIISKKINLAKIVAKKSNYQMLFKIIPRNSVIIEFTGDQFIIKCKLLLQFCLLC